MPSRGGGASRNRSPSIYPKGDRACVLFRTVRRDAGKTRKPVLRALGTHSNPGRKGPAGRYAIPLSLFPGSRSPLATPAKPGVLRSSWAQYEGSSSTAVGHGRCSREGLGRSLSHQASPSSAAATNHRCSDDTRSQCYPMELQLRTLQGNVLSQKSMQGRVTVCAGT